MIKPRLFSFLLLVVLIALLSPVFAGDAAPVLKTANGEVRDWAPIALRGYGTVSGNQVRRQLPSGPASILDIHCESEEKARIVQAKYLSDFGLLPGVTPLTTRIGTLTGRQADGQGAVAALRSGSNIFILAATNPGDLKALAEENLASGLKIDSTEPEVHVPMYLDRWDKYGFRFYYQPFSTPLDAKGHGNADYDQTQDFDFAEKSGHAGLVMWESANGQDTAEGVMDTPSWSWVLDEAKKRSLPIGVNAQ